ncbi:Dabb family protein [Nocardia neocaledoniensis]|uniref:Dabb family protein n=1 Tax=Nocardia neocaledoniensis TaxID=236511 RepID=UPI002456F6A6|nr:Dabb family protein [Nocardia neocaledoniensis]
MYEMVRLIHFAPGTDPVTVEQWTSALRTLLPGARRTLVEPTLPGVRNGGDVLAHWWFDEAADWARAGEQVTAVFEDPVVAHVDGAEYLGGTSGLAEPEATGTVHRVLLLRVAPQTPGATVRRFEADLLRMPEHIPTIRTWQLSPVLRATGSSPWTHVWEQEFTDLDGLNGPYLMHPVHWALVDRWFDPECPEMIVRDRVCHSFCRNTPRS